MPLPKLNTTENKVKDSFLGQDFKEELKEEFTDLLETEFYKGFFEGMFKELKENMKDGNALGTAFLDGLSDLKQETTKIYDVLQKQYDESKENEFRKIENEREASRKQSQTETIANDLRSGQTPEVQSNNNFFGLGSLFSKGLGSSVMKFLKFGLKTSVLGIAIYGIYKLFTSDTGAKLLDTLGKLWTEKFVPVFEKIGDLFEKIYDIFSPIIEKYSETLGRVAVDTIVTVFESLAEFLEGIASGLEKIVSGDAIEGATKIVVSIGNLLKNIFNVLLTSVAKLLGFEETAKDVTDWINQQDFSRIIKSIIESFTDMFSSVKGLFSGLFSSFDKLLEGDFSGFFQQAKDTIQMFLSSMLKNVINLFLGIFNFEKLDQNWTLSGFIDETATDIKDWFAEIFSFEGLDIDWSISDFVTGVFNKVINWFESKISGVELPSISELVQKLMNSVMKGIISILPSELTIPEKTIAGFTVIPETKLELFDKNALMAGIETQPKIRQESVMVDKGSQNIESNKQASSPVIVAAPTDNSQVNSSVTNVFGGGNGAIPSPHRSNHPLTVYAN